LLITTLPTPQHQRSLFLARFTTFSDLHAIMPRKQFIADLQKALSGVRPPGIQNIKAGEEDGQLEFEFVASNQEGTTHITAMIPDVSDYPKSHEYMIFCGDNTPSHVAQALQSIRNTSRKTVFELIDVISASLTALASPSEDFDGDHIMGESQEDLFDESEDEDAVDVYGDDDEAFDYGDQVQIRPAVTAHLPPRPQENASRKSDRSFRDRVRADLSAAKGAGFKVGHLGSLMNGCSSFVTVSIRMSKLNLSEEAMQAWKVDPSEYLILVIQYPNGYKTGEQLQAYDSLRLTPNIGMQVFAGKGYKPTLKEAINAFTKARQDRTSASSDDKKDEDDAVEESSIQNTFISKSLSMLLEKNLIPILRFRSQGMDWTGAEAWYNQMQRACSSDDANMVPAKYFGPEVVNNSHPEIMRADHYHQTKQSQHSFPLLAMQFALRHFVRCTEFCLICHDKLDSELEAIKPYVCERPLCLFQYMSLGFGPSIEHEIITQPCVVDLLISFCYASARSEKLKEFPDGLNLMVPPSKSYQDGQTHSDSYNSTLEDSDDVQGSSTQPYEVGFDSKRMEVMFFETKMPVGGCPLARGQWIVIRGKQNSLGDDVEEVHCRVRDPACYPTIKVDEPVFVTLKPEGSIEGGTHLAARTTAPPVTPTATPKFAPSTLTKYSQEFSMLEGTKEKCDAICRLLDILPSVNELRDYLSQNDPTELGKWVERLPRDAISLLRWIIASNRSCIMQVDNQEGGKTSNHKEERMHGMEGFMQFRFAMGAPDKESRFVSEVRKTTERLSLKHPTIFAWHGSPLQNWHMIIREGLHFQNTDHGRAYGHGVYHAKDAATSMGYSGHGRVYSYGPGAASWTKSALRITSALALNEIVNAPAEFVSQSPFYVVSQLDWIQTRYLLVQCLPTDESAIAKSGVRTPPQQVHPQDSHHTPKGDKGDKIVIPASAIKSGRVREAKTTDKRRSTSGVASGANKRLKDAQGDSVATAIDLEDDDASSVVTDDGDLELLLPEPEPVAAVVVKGKSKPKSSSAPTTDFVPGTLDFSGLPVMPVPTYATSATTKRLMSELTTLAKVQSSTPIADLGWSIDTENIENVYQWIVELHSFHTFSINSAPLPLAQDMKAANATSIVLEIRFGLDFPFSPPYIRVIRPRFLPFTSGGGGHIVIGGAMCMELLTNSGWSSVMSMESVLMQVRMAIASEPFARLEGKGRTPATGVYGAAEAADGYIRACASHGWTVPPGFKEVAYGAYAAGGQMGAGAEL
jgi:ubiquitin-conjugating enzyme E2 Q